MKTNEQIESFLRNNKPEVEENPTFLLEVQLSSSRALVIRSTHLWQWISGTSRIIIKTSCVILYL